MDQFYDGRKAVEKLQKLVEERNQIKQGTGKLIQIETLNLEDSQISEFGLPKCWRLGRESDTELGTVEDITLRCQGILTVTELPPITPPSNPTAMRRMRPHIRQAITLTGLGLDYFDNIIQKIEQVYIMFSNVLPAKSMIHWQPATYEDMIALDIHARYFTHKSLIKGENTKAFEPFVDPNNVLLEMQEDQYIHHDDNIVEYFGQHITKEGNTIFRKMDPSRFRVGDIVEVALSIACFETKDKKYIMIPILRAITLFDQEIRNTAEILRMRQRYHVQPQIQFKRSRAKIHDDSPEVTEMQQRMKSSKMIE